MWIKGSTQLGSISVVSEASGAGLDVLRNYSRRKFLRNIGITSLASAFGNSFAYQGGLAAPIPVRTHSLLGHHPAKAKRFLMLFLTGGMSHVDTFDPKPKLKERHGKSIPAFGLRPDESKPLPLLGSPFEFSQCGQSGLWISDLFPHLRAVADDLCVIRSLHTDIVEHFQATLAMHTGSATIPMPSLGAWLSFGLGSVNPNLPPFVVVAEHLPYAGAQVWDASFLPPHHQGTRLIPGPTPFPDIRSQSKTSAMLDLEQQMLAELHRQHISERSNDPQLSSRTATFNTARGMMAEAPNVFDLAGETEATLNRYGITRGDNTSFAWQCLIARRLLEREVRAVEVIDTGSHDNWDSHGDMATHKPKARRVDRAMAALLMDLKERGLMEDTLVAICTEFGRTPWSDGGNGKGRNHYAKAFTCLLTGAGVKKGMVYGETDEFGAIITRDPVHVHDYHATILHLLGIEHTRLTYRYAGRDFRLTDVGGNVLFPILA